MTAQPLLPPEEGEAPLDLFAAGLVDGVRGQGGWLVRYEDGSTRPLDVARWCGRVTLGDNSLLARCAGPTLDVGCGPGRLTSALGMSGVPVLGIDVAPGALRIARSAGAVVLQRSVFDRVPGHGRWARVLLADGNIGIGGDAALLLSRVGSLLASDGLSLVEVEAPGAPTARTRLRLESPDGRWSRWFPWSHVGVDGVEDLAAEAGLCVAETWSAERRWFVALGKQA